MKNQKIQLNKRLAGYSATAVALAALTANTDGQVVYSGLQNIVVKNTSDSVDMDGDSIKDFRIINMSSVNWRSATLQVLQSGNQWVGSNPYALNSGYFISSSRSFYSSSHPYNLGSYNIPASHTYGNFPGAGDKFIGVRFLIDGSTHYGWIRINIPASIDSITIKDWAYQKTAGYGLETGIIGAPVLSDVSVDNIGMDTATFNITADKQSRLQYGVKLASDPAPTFEELFDGTGFVYNDGLDVTAGTPNNLPINGLSPNVAYTIYASAIDNSADTSAISSINFSTIDTIPPVLSDISVDSIGGYTASVFVTSDENGSIYYAVKLSAESAPTVGEIKAGTGFVAAGNSADTSGNAKQFDITGLANITAYKVYFVAENLSGYTSVVRDTSFSTLDVVPPVLSATSVDNIQTTSASGHITSSEKGTAYFAVKAAADLAPDSTQIKTGTGFVTAGSFDLDAATPIGFNILGLNESTAYKIYMTAEDTSNNLSAVAQVSFTTANIVGITDISKNNITINPNPATNVLYISAQEKSAYTIVDALGQMIQTGKLEAGKSEVNISSLSQGIYFIRINLNNGTTFVQQIMKK